MTNAQAALIAAASVHPQASSDRRTQIITSRAESMLAWLEAQDAAQEATSAPQAAEQVIRCSRCNLPIEPSPSDPGWWRDAVGLWGNGDHDHHP
jgi:hypothetical protein